MLALAFLAGCIVGPWLAFLWRELGPAPRCRECGRK